MKAIAYSELAVIGSAAYFNYDHLADSWSMDEFGEE